MCGLAGLARPGGLDGRAPARLSAMIGALHHRGPDGQGQFVDGPVGLAHARLSIVDLAGGAQPIFNEDGSVAVVFNGEIFNHVELRTALEARGHVFRTHSDTEVLVHLWEDLGERFLEPLNGQFAIALWDARQQVLLLARDRTGIRPLFHAQVDGGLAFASEVKALWADPVGAPPRVWDAGGLAETFGWWSPRAPRTPFAGISQLPPGHLLRWNLAETGARPMTRRWWDWDFRPDPAAPRTLDEAAEALRPLLADAVRLQLRADVPVGAYLSGGLDSSIITTLIHDQGDVALRSFSLGFEDAEFDEHEHQEALVRHLGSAHSGLRVSRADIAAAFARAVHHAEAPLLRTAPVPMMLLADHVRASGFKVVLTGEGADEVFAGYDLFREAQVRRFMARAPGSAWRGRILERLYPWLPHAPGRGALAAAQFFRDGADALERPWGGHATRLRAAGRVRQFLRPAWRHAVDAHDLGAELEADLPAALSGWAPLHRDQYVEATTLLPGYLLAAQGDRMAMAASIEARFPFLDHRVIEFAGGLPPGLKLQGLREKRVLKQAMAHRLPPVITARSKQPYRAPDSACFFEQGRPLDWVEALMSPAAIEAAGLFDPAPVGKLLAKCAAGRAIGFPDNMAFTGILSCQLLHRDLGVGA